MNSRSGVGLDGAFAVFADCYPRSAPASGWRELPLCPVSAAVAGSGKSLARRPAVAIVCAVFCRLRRSENEPVAIGWRAVPLLLIAVALGQTALRAGDAPAHGPPHRHNLLLVLYDDLRFNTPGYAGGEARTPSMDRLAQRAAVFGTASTCRPTSFTAATRNLATRTIRCSTGMTSGI